jgi:hypothetical protein
VSRKRRGEKMGKGEKEKRRRGEGIVRWYDRTIER